MRAIAIAVVVMLALTGAACVKRPTFACTADSQCGPGGVCEPVGYCAFADLNCASGERFGELSGSYSNQCAGGGTVDAFGPDADLSCVCQTDHLSCQSGTVSCPLGCTNLPSGGARCLQIVPSNGIDPVLTTAVTMPITFAGLTTFDTDTGELAGALTRTAGQGVMAGIGYYQPTASLGVFVFDSLEVASGASIHFTGMRSVVLLVGTDAMIDGTIDGSGGCYGMDLTCAGPGGGVGASGSTPAGGCSPGGAGQSQSGGTNDGGGGGGGGGLAGGSGGTAAASAVGGAAGNACIASALEPLVGGSGGGAGGPGAAASSSGGGGGGAIQLTALGMLTVTGTITMGGAGGPGGPADANNAGAGGGGGAGGGILLEAISVNVTGILAANGGGGGGGGHSPNGGNAGEPGMPSSTAAGGGAPVSNNGAGGSGGALGADAQAGQSTGGNAGGGGGGAGVIYLRAIGTPSVTGTTSPTATTGTIGTS